MRRSWVRLLCSFNEFEYFYGDMEYRVPHQRSSPVDDLPDGCIQPMKIREKQAFR